MIHLEHKLKQKEKEQCQAMAEEMKSAVLEMRHQVRNLAVVFLCPVPGIGLARWCPCLSWYGCSLMPSVVSA